jgi:hypothetical protein
MQGELGRESSSDWYPPLEKTLSCLLKLYRCLEPEIFTGLAQVLLLNIFVTSIFGSSCIKVIGFMQDSIATCSTSIQLSV